MSYVVIYIGSRLFEIGEKWLKHPLTVLAVFKKGSNSNFLEQNKNFFFVNDARFARKHVGAYSKLVGTPSFKLFFFFRILILLSNPSITIIMMIGIPQSIVTAKVLYTIMETTTKWTIGSVTYAKMTLFSGKKRKSESKN